MAITAAGLPAAKARHCFYRVRAKDPIHDVQVVDVLLDDMVTA
jgi:hypothetical protein